MFLTCGGMYFSAKRPLTTEFARTGSVGVTHAAMHSDSRKVRPGMRAYTNAAETSQAVVITSRRSVVRDSQALKRYRLQVREQAISTL